MLSCISSMQVVDVDAYNWLERVLLRCAIHHGLIHKMFTYVGCAQRIKSNDKDNCTNKCNSNDNSATHDSKNSSDSNCSSMVHKLRQMRVEASIIHSDNNEYTTSQMKMLQILFEGLKDARLDFVRGMPITDFDLPT